MASMQRTVLAMDTFTILSKGPFRAVAPCAGPRQMAQRWRTRLSQAAGAAFEVAGREMWAVPTADAMVELGAGGVAAATGMELAGQNGWLRWPGPPRRASLTRP